MPIFPKRTVHVICNGELFKMFDCEFVVLQKVEKVTEEAESPEEEEDGGVVHGAITLGGEWPKSVKKIR